jgi:hypothetical protein
MNGGPCSQCLGAEPKRVEIVAGVPLVDGEPAKRGVFLFGRGYKRRRK